MKMWRSLSKICGVVVLVAVSACPADEVESGPETPAPPTDEEIQAVWEGYCHLTYSELRVTRCFSQPVDLEAAHEACLDGQHGLYYCMAGCVEPNYAAQKCLVEAHAELDYNDPLNEYYLCKLRETPECRDLVNAAEMVQCGGCDWSGALTTSGGSEAGAT